MFNIFKNKSNLKSVSVDELKEILGKEKPILIDVRTTDEYSEGHIKQAQNIPLDQIDKVVEKYKDNKKPIYVICRGGNRSEKAQKYLAKNGIETINVKGGMLAWESM
ncbi:rhodanese-like domain-containing protein [Oceanivirga salmonicida]|uniref:rhodanese-like domain-containing protein n=1 Tax=Oceanivirga salmonicida TaxID=1769291 RepID=UPI0012E14367|nr:rhodanese-like domain-containing protein [Oceanivirga salmonicida]